MALFRCTQVFRFSANFIPANARANFVKRKSTKKQYAYDLDSLILWKKETDHVFGAKSKVTKTGKVRKSKKNSPFNENNANRKDIDIPAQVTSPQVPLPDAVYSVDSSLENTPSKEQCKQYVQENHTISPLPVPDSRTHNEFNIKATVESSQSLDKTTLARIKSVQHFGSSKLNLVTNETPFLTVNSLKHNNEDHRKFTEEITTNYIKDLSEIVIPKLAPIPQPKSPTSQSFLLNNITPTLSKFDSTSTLPVEPPPTYDVISKMPLFPKDSTSWPKAAELDQFSAFQNDIKLLSFRTPPSVKSILSKSMPSLNRFFLERWRENLIKQLGEEGFREQQEATIRKGSNLHANINDYLSGKPVSELHIMPDNQGHWASLQSTFKIISNIVAVEGEVFHPFLLYKGVFDCLAQYKDLLCIIDWKTSKKARPHIKDTYDDPLQIVAYMGAINANEEYVRKFGQVNNGMIVVAYPDGQPAHVHIMDKTTSKEYWRTWTDRLYDFYQLTYTEKFGAKTAKATNTQLAEKIVS